MADIECAVSGIIAEPVEEFKDDGLEGLPPGWTQITLKRRAPNPKFYAIQRLKEAMIENMVVQARQQQLPEEARQMQELAIQLQVEATMAALEAKTPLYITTTEVIHIAPPNTDPGIREVVSYLNESLSLNTFEDVEEVEEDEAEPVEDAPKKASTTRKKS